MSAPRSPYHIYCDESSQTKHRYLVIGACICDATAVALIEKSIELAIEPHGLSSELKWGKIKRKNKAMYLSVVKSYFQLQRMGLIQYFSIIIDTSKSDHKTFNEGDKEIGFNKYLFTLLFKFVRRFPERVFFGFLDDRTTKHTPEAMRRMLNLKAAKEIRRSERPFRQLAFRPSHEERIIQVVDILTGAIAFHWNNHHKADDAAAYKIEAAELVAQLAGVKTLAAPTLPSMKEFDIWLLDFTKSKRGSPRT